MSKEESPHTVVPEESNILFQWLGAVFEVEGTMFFNVESKPSAGHSQARAWPTIRLQSDKSVLLKEVKEILATENPLTEAKSTGSHTFSIAREKAAISTQYFRCFAPSRETTIEYFSQWLKAKSNEERYQVGTNFKQLKMKQPPVTLGEYKKLIELPAFVAGLLDARGSISDVNYEEYYPKNQATYHRHRRSLKVYSSKIELLTALQHRFLGIKPSPSGKGFMWRVESIDLDNVLSFVWPYLIRLHI